MSKFNEKLREFMYGRNGFDQLNLFLMIIYLIVFIINSFADTLVLAIIELILVIIWFFRVYSRNLEKRRKENYVYLRVQGKVLLFFSKIFSIFKRKK